MPNRMIRDWTDSLRMDGLSAEAERLFTRLIMKADDYGRFHSEIRLVKASCFPLSEDIRPSEIGPWLNELADRGLVLIYEAGGRKLLAIANYGQRLRTSRAKFLQMPGQPDEWLPGFDCFLPTLASCGQSADKCPQLPATSRESPPEGKGIRMEYEAEGNPKPKTEDEAPPSPQGGILPHGWKKLTKTEQSRKKVNFNDPTMIRIGKFFGQKESTLWTIAEYVALQDVNPPDDEVALIEEHYSFVIEKNGYRFTTISTLLNNWSAARAKANNYFEENPEARTA